MKNTIAILSLVLLAGLGYFLFLKPDTALLNNAAISAQVLAKTQVFIERRNQLEAVSIESASKILFDPRFTGLTIYSPAIAEQTTGKENIFIIPDGLTPTAAN